MVAAETASLEDWTAKLADPAAWTDGLAEPFDDVPSFDAETDPEVDVTAGLSSDRAYLHQPTRRLFIDYRPNPDALKHLEQMPIEGETLHGVISGKYALWQLVPALIERTGQKITDLHIATLSYSKDNAAELLALLDEGQIDRVSLVVSYYFKKTNQALYDTLVPPLLQRGHRVLANRNHCKIILARITDGTAFVVEASANLRSCKSLEQFSLTRDVGLYEFHRHWIDDELLRPRSREERDG